MIPLAILVASVLTASWGILGTYSWMRRRRLHHALRVQETLARFASARHRLVRLAMAGKLSTESATFSKFYYLHTGLMRRPDEYREISDRLAHAMVSPPTSSGKGALEMESVGWDEETRLVADETVKGLTSLLIDYSPARRGFFWVARRLHGLTIFRAKLERFVVALEDRTRPDLRELRTLKDHLSDLISPAPQVPLRTCSP